MRVCVLQAPLFLLHCTRRRNYGYKPIVCVLWGLLRILDALLSLLNLIFGLPHYLVSSSAVALSPRILLSLCYNAL